MADQTPESADGRSSLGGPPDRLLAAIRLGIGLIQGGLLYFLYQATDHGPRYDENGLINAASLAWPATHPPLFGALLLTALYLPIVVLAGVGRLRRVTMAVWGGVAGLFLFGLGWHDVARQAADNLAYPPYLDFPPLPFLAAALFIAHHLIVPADRERRLFAAFPAYFDTAWKAGVQLALSIGFVGAFWILLFLGAALFHVIGLNFLRDLIAEEWFFIPVTTLTFAVAVHLTDVRDGLIRGVRTVALMLLSWLLPVIALLTGGFLLALPFTGLSGLSDAFSASALVLTAAAALIILINTAYQDGRPDNLPPVVLRGAARIAAVLLAPLALIAVWGLALRIGQYGLTPARLIASACALVGAVYAGGYGFAALSPFWRRSEWMKPLERTNVVAAILSVLLIVLLFSPVLDPARLSVADQTARLARGAVSPADFDYAFLRFESGKAGRAALDRLAASADPEIARRAKDAKASENRWSLREEMARVDKPIVIEAWPEGTTLPPEFLIAGPLRDPRAHCSGENACVAALIDADGDGAPEILLTNDAVFILYRRMDDGWVQVGAYPRRSWGEGTEPTEALKSGSVRFVPPTWPELVVGDQPPVTIVRSMQDEAVEASGQSAD